MHKFCGPICLIMHLIIFVCTNYWPLCDACLSWELYNEVNISWSHAFP